MFSMLGTVCYAQTEPNKTAPTLLDAKLTLRKQKVMVGEPIVVEFTFTNNRAEEINASAMTGYDNQSFARLSLKTSQGAVLAWETERDQSPEIHMGGVQLTPLPIGPSKDYSGAIVVPNTVLPKTPGHYVLHIAINLPYRTQRSGERIYKAESNLALDVTPGKNQELITIAQQLRKDTARAEHEGVLATRALLQMPEKIAAPYWESIAGAPSSSYSPKLQVFVDVLRARRNAFAVTLLARMWDTAGSRENPLAKYGEYSQPGLKASMAQQALTFMYPRSGSAVKAQIREIFLFHDKENEANELPESVDKEKRPTFVG
ncbi:MAG: hypothetical protein V4671_21315 [Armatimonadota bacterium]